jgi:hypothetical protein
VNLAYRPYMTSAMARAAMVTLIFGIIMIAFGVVVECIAIAAAPNADVLIHMGLPIFLFNVVPGIWICFLSVQMNRVKLWAFVGVIVTIILLFVQSILSLKLGDVGGIEIVLMMVLRIPLVYLIAALLNAMPNVIDGYRGYRRDREMVKRGFEPIMHASGKPGVAKPPPPVTTIRR